MTRPESQVKTTRVYEPLQLDQGPVFKPKVQNFGKSLDSRHFETFISN